MGVSAGGAGTMHEFEELSLENQEAIEELAWTLNASRGEFALVVVRCNFGQLRDRAIATLQAQVADILVWQVPLETTALLEGIVEAAVGRDVAAVMVTGLEGVRDLDELLSSTNRIREEFRARCPYPVVLWVTDVGLRSLMRMAPDFESWGTTTQLEISLEELNRWFEIRFNEWFTDVRKKRIPSQVEWAALEQEFYAAEELMSKAQVEPSDEFIRRRDAVLGSIYYAQGKANQSIDSFQKALESWESDLRLGRAKVLEGLIASYYFQGADQYDRSTSTWSDLRETVEKYLNFCAINCPQLPVKMIPILGDILLRLEKWDILKSLSQTALQEIGEVDNNLFAIRLHGFLAEVSANSKNWQEVSSQATFALEKIEAFKLNNPACQIVIKDSVDFNRLIISSDEPWFRKLLASAMFGMGDVSEATHLLENTKRDFRASRHRLLYLEILADLERLYRIQNAYLKAFEIKQERLVIEQQMRIRAFSGAGWLRSEQKMQLILETLNIDMTGDEIATALQASGRSQDIQNLLSRIASTEHKLTVLYGASGVGKSSLVSGGLVPALKQKAIGSRDNIPILLREYTNWAGSLLAEMEGVDTGNGAIEQILQKLRQNEDKNLRTILIFDQFEEFFFVQPDRPRRQDFYTFLGRAILLPNVNIILSLREDYLHYVLECEREMTMVEGGDVLSRKVRYEIGNFSSEDARSIIADLTDRSQFRLEPALLDRLVADLAEPLKEVRPIELQIVGAQLQTEGIQTLAAYPKGGKTELVDRYLMETIKDCGEGNGEIAELLGYLLTDEKGTRPLKTRRELERELEDLNRLPEPEQLDLVLAVMTGSGLVMQIKASPEDRYQLVHDYLAGVIRSRQKPRFDRLAQELEEERLKRKEAEDALTVAKKALSLVREDTKKTEVEKKTLEEDIQNLLTKKTNLEKEVVLRDQHIDVWTQEYERKIKSSYTKEDYERLKKQYERLEENYINLHSNTQKSVRKIFSLLETLDAEISNETLQSMDLSDVLSSLRTEYRNTLSDLKEADLSASGIRRSAKRKANTSARNENAEVVAVPIAFFIVCLYVAFPKISLAVLTVLLMFCVTLYIVKLISSIETHK
jgi:hypothetical protein